LLLFIDNFDSFTYNLVQAFQCLGVEVEVCRAHLSHFETCLQLKPRYIVLGPGPGHPQQAYLSQKLIQHLVGQVPILGICLGHQVLAEYYGSSVERAPTPIHGKAHPIFHSNQGILTGIPQGFLATRYHSLIVNRQTVKAPLTVTAWTATGEVMGLKHQSLPLESVQFHPESILTTQGPALLRNFLDNAPRPY